MFEIWRRWMNLPEQQKVDRYHISAITHEGELVFLERLPLEIRYVLAARPDRLETFRDLLQRGYGIGIRTVDHTPETILHAVDAISHLTQENTIIPWLPRLLREGELPIFTEYELRSAEEKGLALYELTRHILAHRYEFKKIVLIDLMNKGLSEADRELMNELNADLYPYAINYIVNRVIFDNAHTRTEVAQSILKALIVIGPIAHVLEHWIHGIGKLFAASADDVLGEVAELYALHGSGFTWRQLMKRSRILIPIFALATWGALSVEGFIERGQIGLGGIVFGLSAVALSLTTAIQSIGLYRQAYKKLFKKGKLTGTSHGSEWSLAFRQDFSNPARFGLFIGAAAAPMVAAIVFVEFPELVHNGLVLALLGSVESVVAGLTVILAARLNRERFRSRIKRELLRLSQA